MNTETVREIPAIIAGERVSHDSHFALTIPGSQRVVANVAESTVDDVEAAISAAEAAGDEMAQMPAHQRQSILRNAANLLKEREEEFARVLVEETGKTLKDAYGELARAWETISFSADACTQAIGEVLPASTVGHGEGMFCFTIRVPVGIIAAITPFNAPVSVGSHKIAPAIAGGNTIVLKPAPRGATTSLMLVELFHDAGLPPAALNLVHGGVEAGQALTSDSRVGLINFTGGGRTADAIIRQAGMKRTVLELGGNGAVVIHNDADLDKAIPACVVAAFGLTGQSCVSLQRLYVHQDIYEETVERMVNAANNLKVGNPFEADTDVGPLISEDSAKRIEQWTKDARANGARVLAGGGRDGAYFEPTVVVDADSAMLLVCDEVFGPLVTITSYDEFDEALDLINDSPWGLQAGIFTKSLELAFYAAKNLKVGGVMINAPNRYRVENMPYGGVKESGWGREGAKYAIQDMTDLRTVLIRP